MYPQTVRIQLKLPSLNLKRPDSPKTAPGSSAQQDEVGLVPFESINRSIETEFKARIRFVLNRGAGVQARWVGYVRVWRTTHNGCCWWFENERWYPLVIYKLYQHICFFVCLVVLVWIGKGKDFIQATKLNLFSFIFWVHSPFEGGRFSFCEQAAAVAAPAVVARGPHARELEPLDPPPLHAVHLDQVLV